MTAGAYTSDLTTQTISAADNVSQWNEFNVWNYGGGPTLEGDYFIQGTGSISQLITKSGLASACYNIGSTITIPQDGAFTAWVNVVASNLLETDTNGGLRLAMGDALGAFKGWNLGGKTSYVYGGWLNLAVNPAINGGTSDYTVGSPTGAWGFVGVAINLITGASRGNYFSIDALRYGRCEMRMVGGTSPDAACTFASAASTNDSQSNRWGLLQAISGGYLWKGLMVLGYGGAIRFTDSNTQVLVDRTPKVTSAFNKIEIRNASSEVNWTAISFLSLTGNGGTIPNTASKGSLEVVDDCDVNISGCTFTGMNTFIFKAGSDILTSVFRNCGQVTANGANFAGTQFIGYEGTVDTAYLLWNTNVDPQSKLSSCTFTKGTAATHAISFTDTNLTTIHIPTSCTFSGYNASNDQNDSMISFTKTSGTIDVYYDGTLSYKKPGGLTVNVHASQPTLTIAGNVSLSGAEVRIYDLDNTLPNLGTELAGTESCPTATYDFTGSAANVIWIQVMKSGYTEFGQQVTMPSANQTLTILLQQELNA